MAIHIKCNSRKITPMSLNEIYSFLKTLQHKYNTNPNIPKARQLDKWYKIIVGLLIVGLVLNVIGSVYGLSVYKHTKSITKPIRYRLSVVVVNGSVIGLTQMGWKLIFFKRLQQNILHPYLKCRMLYWYHQDLHCRTISKSNFYTDHEKKQRQILLRMYPRYLHPKRRNGIKRATCHELESQIITKQEQQHPVTVQYTQGTTVHAEEQLSKASQRSKTPCSEDSRY